ncbi:MAG: Probable outer membrane receptor protein [uncultured Adhaeribacter sp.]|uniref:Probable outer membrane receptor protein n=1 Tax=uncultured Adhaeribacter sp. TaxID=448109 RepID=A0A6J4H9U0_9BACT|nr:MAG: Probable outer membrane receptor protein [uncultured Adhaeribacter sp.]
MKKYTLFLLLFNCFTGWAQTTVSGTITDHHGNPIIGANVFLKGLYDGASADTNGQYSFKTTATGPQILIATFIGYKPRELPIELKPGTQTINIPLTEERNHLNTVVITAGAFEASDEKRATLLKPLDIATTAGATADIAGALNTLPGTTKVGETGKLFVRGGDSYETKTFIDGLLVNKFYNSSVPNVATRGRFSPFLFSGTVFSSGGYSAEYGQALSSALLLNSSDLAAESQTGISLLAVGVSASETKRWENTSLAVAMDYTNLAPLFGLVKQDLDWEKAPESVGGSTVFRHRTSKTGLLKVFGSFSQSNMVLHQPDLDREQGTLRVNLRNQNTYLNASYREILGPKWTVRAGLAFSRDRDQLGLNKDKLNTQEGQGFAKTVFTYQATEAIAVKIGGEYQQKFFDQSYFVAEPQEITGGIFTDRTSAVFTEADVYLSNRLVLRPGLRAEYGSRLNRANIAPRASLAYKTGSYSQVSAAFGHYYQTPENDYLKYTRHLNFERATHYILNYQHIREHRTFRLEGFYKQYNQLIKFQQPNNFTFTNLHNGGGYAKGLEVFWRDQKTIKRGDYWVSYSFLDTKRNHKFYESEVTPTFAAKHNLAVVYKHFLPKLQTLVGATYSVASGRPYHNPNLPGYNQATTPTYTDLSVNISYLTNIKKHYTILYVSCTNLLGRENIYGYRFGNVPDATNTYRSLAITPPAPRFAFVGLLISINHPPKKNYE